MYIESEHLTILAILAIAFTGILTVSYRIRIFKEKQLRADLATTAILRQPTDCEVTPPIASLDSPESFHIRDEPIRDDISIYNRIVITSCVHGNIHAQRGSALKLYGICMQNIYVKPGAAVVVHGTVVGDIHCTNAEVHVFGKIIGKIIDTDNSVKVHPSSQVLSLPHGSQYA